MIGVCCPASAPSPILWEAPAQTWARDNSRLFRALLLTALLSLIFIPEYVQGLGDPASKSLLYSQAFGGLRILDALLLVAFAIHVLAFACLRLRPSRLPRGLVLLIMGFASAVAVSLTYGMQHGGKNFFFDWRALALGMGFYVTYRVWIEDTGSARQALVVFGVVVAVRIMLLLGMYLAGGGDTLLGIRIPAFDGPTVSAAVFAALLGLSLSGNNQSSWCRGGWLLLAAMAILLVVLCFRRTYWAELAVGIVILGPNSGRQWLRGALVLACIAALAWIFMGRSMLERVASLDFTSSDSSYAGDNADHVGDLLDAWDQVKVSPMMGVGLGHSYPTWRIRNWKDESVMVHNAPLHVWLKYGLLGLAFYLLYHLALFRYLRQHAKRSTPLRRPVVVAVLAYLAAQFLVSLGFAPWPYSAVQSTNLIAFLLAVAFTREPECHFQVFP